MRKKKECSTDGYSPVTCKTTFTYGNTVINVVECFPKEGPTITERIIIKTLYLVQKYLTPDTKICIGGQFFIQDMHHS